MPRRDFITPPSLPTEYIQRCVYIPASQEWLGLINAALLMLTQEWRYEQLYETSLTAADTAAEAMEIYTAYLEGACGVDDVRQSIIDPCTLEKTFDQGATWEIWANLLACSIPVASARPPLSADIRVEDGVPEWSPDGGETWLPVTPSGGTRYTPPSAAVPGDTDDAKKCLAAARVARAMSEAYRGTFGMVAAGLANNLGRMNNFLYDLNSALFQVLYSPGDGILESWLFSAQDFEENYTAPALTAPQEAALTCLLLENSLLIAGSKVQFEFSAVRDNLVSYMGANPGLALTYLFDNVGAAGIDWAGGSGILSDADCADCYTWCFEMDFTSNSYSSEVTILNGSYVPGSGIKGGSPPPHEQALIAINFAGTVNFDSLYIEWSVDNAAGVTVTPQFSAACDPDANDPYVAGSGVHSSSWSGAFCVDGSVGNELQIEVVGQSPATVYTYIRKVRMSGSGESPFPAISCP